MRLIVAPSRTGATARSHSARRRWLHHFDDGPTKLRPDEWRSGEILWLIDEVGDAKAIRHLLARLWETAFKGREVKILRDGADPRPFLGTLARQRRPIEEIRDDAAGLDNASTYRFGININLDGSNSRMDIAYRQLCPVLLPGISSPRIAPPFSDRLYSCE